ncbi:hypothetical protein HHI36_003587 [Cryptolaemus montrouzieri]|uniref:HTH psq-type domain-containing protein n=2 Tax=Cryptolaemus montrouzieri TaxID=559131 RepID=A0ABD2PEM2_9CUCU
MVRTYKPKTDRKNINEESIEDAIREVLSKTLSIRKAADKYGIKTATLQHRIEKARKSFEATRPLSTIEASSSLQAESSLSQAGPSSSQIAPSMEMAQIASSSAHTTTAALSPHTATATSSNIYGSKYTVAQVFSTEQEKAPPEKNRLESLRNEKNRKRELQKAKQHAKELKTAKNLLGLTEPKKKKRVTSLPSEIDSDSSQDEVVMTSDSEDIEMPLESEEEVINEEPVNPEHINIGDFLLIKFEKKKTVIHYIAKVVFKYSVTEYEVLYLRKKQGLLSLYFQLWKTKQVWMLEM